MPLLAAVVAVASEVATASEVAARTTRNATVNLDRQRFRKTLNKSLECGFSNEELFRFNILQERLSRPTDLFSVSLGAAIRRRQDAKPRNRARRRPALAGPDLFQPGNSRQLRCTRVKGDAVSAPQGVFLRRSDNRENRHARFGRTQVRLQRRLRRSISKPASPRRASTQVRDVPRFGVSVLRRSCC